MKKDMLFPIPYTKINSKCIKDLNVKGKIIKLSEENISINLYDFRLGKAYLDMMQKVQAAKPKNK